MQAPNLLLGQCLSAKVENPIARHNQLPERQEKNLSRLRDLDTADGMPNAKNSDEKKAILALVPFALSTSARRTRSPARGGPQREWH